eukprot:GHVR01185034.1.p1 GENE.GHVR01185034.1~~GHVR01185034.1.p1  ORF type:complete len:406 (+),score=46.39 GHVR01185034.1:30-1220(+)
MSMRIPKPPAPGNFLFTSESVNEGHPDKLCDQVSDSILDACLIQDPESKVACECCCKSGLVMVFGEISTKAKVNYEKVVRDTCKNIGYDSEEKGLDYRTMNVIVSIEEQSHDIAQAVFENKSIENIGAGDQGHMFGYACNETPEMMPMTHQLATSLGKQLSDVRKDGTCQFLRPDGKTQVTIEYKKGEDNSMIPQRIHTVLISTQHSADVTNDYIRDQLMKHVVTPVVPANLIDEDTIFHLNPSGRFVIGGPHGDAGLTGRKIIVDTYGGWGAHGGGAFSGKDTTKVDRSAAYACRWAAKSVVAAGLALRCLVQVSYSIGLSQPLSMFVDTYGTAQKDLSDDDILAIIQKNFDFRPGCLQRDLELKKPIFSKVAAYGHFGRDIEDATWEKPKELIL